MRARRGAAPGNAKPRRSRLVARWRSWRGHHSQSAAESLARVLQRPLSSLMTWLVIGVAIALPTALWVLLGNVQALSDRMESPAQISVFLQAGVDAQRGQEIARSIAGQQGVQSALFVDRDVALEEFIASSSLGDLAAHLPANPLPHLILVTPQDAALVDLGELPEMLAALDGVDDVVLDAEWVNRLRAFMELGERGVQLLALLLLVAVVLVLGNSIRLEIESRREEIIIVKLVGGSDAFARRPLLYTGLWFGLGGGIVAALLVLMGTLLMASPVEQLAQAYRSDFELRGLGLVDSLQLALMGASLGLLGAWMAVFRHLRNIQPQ